ncbi:hypothetical protein D9M70_479740 [compost metagenome]
MIERRLADDVARFGQDIVAKPGDIVRFGFDDPVTLVQVLQRLRREDQVKRAWSGRADGKRPIVGHNIGHGSSHCMFPLIVTDSRMKTCSNSKCCRRRQSRFRTVRLGRNPRLAKRRGRRGGKLASNATGAEARLLQ